MPVSIPERSRVMGGRGTAGKTKLFTNIDADRNRPFREVRMREIEFDRQIQRQNPKPAFEKLTESQLSEMSPRQRGYMRVEIAIANRDIKQLHRAQVDVSEFVNAPQKIGNSFKRPDFETRKERIRAISDLSSEIDRAYRKLGHPEFANER